MKKFKVFILHHTHTDIGYTDYQEKIMSCHADYIMQAVDILNSGKHPGFKWICEGFAGVEEFCKRAPKQYVSDFEKYLRDGGIGLSASYFNLTEALGKSVSDAALSRAEQYARRVGARADCALNADINGYSWGYCDSLAEHGVENLMYSMNIHHGLFPLFRKQSPFWWKGKSGKRVLAWVGEHYNLGNAFGFAPGFSENYVAFSKEKAEEDLTRPIRERLLPYLEGMEKEGYPYDFIPVGISGIFTDNAPPNPRIAEAVSEWNAKYGTEVELCMATLSDFFEHARGSGFEFPEYSGDWTDWWADGIGSTPDETALFREAQRKYELCKLLDGDAKYSDPELTRQTEDNLLYYAEHTWGYSASVSEPWNHMTKSLDLRKSNYAVQADILAAKQLGRILRSKGDVPLRPGRALHYKLVNPFAHPYAGIARLYLDGWEVSERFEITDGTGRVYPYQTDITSRGRELCLFAELSVNEERKLFVREIEPKKAFELEKYRAGLVAEVSNDPAVSRKLFANQGMLKSPFFELRFGKRGIERMTDGEGNNLLKDSEYTPFAPIYEVTDLQDDQLMGRFRMGRNRSGVGAERSLGELTKVTALAEGELFVRVRLEFKVAGMDHAALELTAYRDLPRLDASLRYNKHSVWNPENVMAALPFTAGEDETLWIEKSGALLRPGIDQLPGTCREFYSVQDGICFSGKARTVAVAFKDAPLIRTGELDWHEIALADEAHFENPLPVFSWQMNNFWETNFRATLGGFHEFRYSVLLCPGSEGEPQSAAEACRNANLGFVSLRTE